MAKAIQLSVIKSKTLYERWPQKPLRRAIYRLLQEAELPAGLYRFELQRIQGVASGRFTELVAEPFTNDVVRLTLNTQLNGYQYMGQLQLSVNARHLSFVQRLQVVAKKLDANNWATEVSSSSSTPIGEGRRALAPKVVATLMNYAPGTEAVIKVSKTDTRIRTFLVEVARLQVEFNQQLAQAKTLQKLEQRRHSACLKSLSLFREESSYMKEKRAEAIEALRRAEEALKSFHAHKVRLVRSNMLGLSKLQQSLQDGSWKWS